MNATLQTVLIVFAVVIITLIGLDAAGIANIF